MEGTPLSARWQQSWVPRWWTETLFAGVASETPRDSGLPGAALLVVLASLLFFARLDAPLLEPQEPRHAEIARQMLVEGRLLVPVLHGEPYLDKPPLLYWLIMGSYVLCGVHDWAARLIPALAGVATVLATYFWGRRVLGSRAGLCGALVLCLSVRFLYLQRMLNFDCLLTLWITAALASAHLSLLGSRLSLKGWLTSACLCGLGLLTKGPVTLVLVLVPLLVYQLLDPRRAPVSVRAWLAYLAVALGVALPWYLAVAWVEPEFLADFLWRHHVERFFTPFDHQEPFWFFVPSVLLGMLPWTLLVPGLLRAFWRRSPRAAARRPGALGLILLAGLWVVLFFSLSGCKRAVYILPALPPLALTLGWWLGVLTGRRGWKVLLRRPSVLAGDAARLVLLATTASAAASLFWELSSLWFGLALGGVAALGLGMLLWRRPISWGESMAITFAALLVGVQTLLPEYNRRFALRAQLQAHVREAEDTPLTVACYPQFWDSVRFYLPDAEVHIYGPAERERLLDSLRQRRRTLVLVKSGRTLDDFLQELPPALEFVPRDRPGAVTVGWVRTRTLPAQSLPTEQER